MLNLSECELESKTRTWFSAPTSVPTTRMSTFCTLARTVEASIDERGAVRLLEAVDLPTSRRALVTILDEEPRGPANELALLSEAALAEDWNRPEEEAAWSHLQPAP